MKGGRGRECVHRFVHAIAIFFSPSPSPTQHSNNRQQNGWKCCRKGCNIKMLLWKNSQAVREPPHVLGPVLSWKPQKGPTTTTAKHDRLKFLMKKYYVVKNFKILIKANDKKFKNMVTNFTEE